MPRDGRWVSAKKRHPLHPNSRITPLEGKVLLASFLHFALRGDSPETGRDKKPLLLGNGEVVDSCREKMILAADAAPQSHPSGLSLVLMQDKSTHRKGWKGSQNPWLLQLGCPHRKGEAPTERGCTQGLHGTHGPSFPRAPCGLALKPLLGSTGQQGGGFHSR